MDNDDDHYVDNDIDDDDDNGNDNDNNKDNPVGQRFVPTQSNE